MLLQMYTVAKFYSMGQFRFYYYLGFISSKQPFPYQPLFPHSFVNKTKVQLIMLPRNIFLWWKNERNTSELLRHKVLTPSINVK